MRWGQHFLVDTEIARRQVAYADLSSNDVVLEIGPGHGVLTKHIAPRVRRIVTIEIDARFVRTLANMTNVETITADVLNVDLKSIPFTKVISNLPYQISSPLTFLLLQQDFELGVLMYQQEFARRLVARSGTPEYSRLSVMAQYHADWELLETVPPRAFRPPPEVHSCIVRVTPRDPPFQVADEQMFAQVVRQLFSHRRKTIKNALRSENALPATLTTAIPYADRRVGKLAPHQIGEISDVLTKRERNHATTH